MSLGMGVMINRLCGNEETVNAVKESLGKTIREISLTDKDVTCRFDDGTSLVLRDVGQSCCESRYVTSDDAGKDFSGHKLVSVEIREAPEIKDDSGESHEVQFLAVKTDKGEFVAETHVEHNGYYGGFSIVASVTE